MSKPRISPFAKKEGPAPIPECAGTHEWWAIRGDWLQPVCLAGPYASREITERMCANMRKDGQACRAHQAPIAERAEILSRFPFVVGGTKRVRGGDE